MVEEKTEGCVEGEENPFHSIPSALAVSNLILPFHSPQPVTRNPQPHNPPPASRT